VEENTERRLLTGNLCGVLLRIAMVIGIGAVTLGISPRVSAEILHLETAVEAAQANDPWLVESQYSQGAVEARSIAAGTLPDPILSMGLANFPTDTFEIDQEPMTQVKVGVTQMFPRGETLSIKRKRLQTQGQIYPYERATRRADTVVVVSKLWFDAYKARESIRLIERDRPLFEQLGEVAEAGYSSALGKTSQQDLIRAQLELVRLDDRVTGLRQKQETLLERLAEWVSTNFAAKYQSAAEVAPDVGADLELPEEMPRLGMLKEDLYTSKDKVDPQMLYSYFADHPAVLAVEQKIKVSDLGIDLARQSYKPQWGVNASYGYRADPSTGDRPDFLSVGLSLDLPFFTKNRQDKELQAAISQAQAVKTNKWSLIRRMIAGFEKNKAQLRNLNQRQQLYQQQLLPQMHEQSEASLTAYTNDVGDFAEVVRARIAELNAHLEALDINVERQKTLLDLNYYFMERAEDIISGI